MTKNKKQEIDLTIHIQASEWEIRLPNIKEVSQEVIALTLKILNLENHPVQLSLVLANDEFLRVYNKQYRSIDKPTNVLSFSALQESRVINDNDNLGDILLAFATLDREAKEQNKTFEEHYKHLLIHGLLHLIGYDHLSEADAEEMESLEIKVLSELGIKNPYELSTTG